MEANTLLAAARLAKPHIHWIEDSGVVFNEASDPDDLEYFTLADEADAYALWKALAEKRVVIWKDGLWHATIAYEDEDLATECETDTDAMLSAVDTLEAMK